MAEADDVLGRCPRAALVVDLDRAVLGKGRRVDEHDRHAGPSDLFDLGVVVAQADGDDAIDGRADHRPCERTMERRDEMERVAGFLGRDRDTFAERAEERVGEDHGQRLRGQEADRQRLALRQHPGDRMGRVTKLLGNDADPVRGLRRQPIRAVEREGHGRLGYAGLAGDVGDTRPNGALIHRTIDASQSDPVDHHGVVPP